MKKIGLLTLLLCFLGLSNISAGTTAGAFSTPESAYATLSFEKLELQLGVNGIFDSKLEVSADYNLFGSKFSLGNARGFFWNGAIGAGLGMSKGYFGVSAIIPFEFGYSFPIFKSGLDVYLQATPVVDILPSLGPDFNIGIGVRIGL